MEFSRDPRDDRSLLKEDHRQKIADAVFDRVSRSLLTRSVGELGRSPSRIVWRLGRANSEHLFAGLLSNDKQPPVSQSVWLLVYRTIQIPDSESTRRKHAFEFRDRIERIPGSACLDRTAANEGVMNIKPALTRIVLGFAQLK